MKECLKKYTSPQGLWRIFCMIVSIEMMGLSLSLLILTDMGTDPFSYMNLGFSSVLHISFGTWQLMMNLILFAFPLLFKRELIGLGTLVNMTAVGYTADFFSSIWNRFSVFAQPLSLGMRILILIPSLALFVVTAAVYMTAELGTAPYDALPLLISQKIKKISFRWVRMLWDTSAMVLGLILGMKIGLITILMVITLGPVVSWFGEHMAGKLFGMVPDSRKSEQEPHTYIP